jgi:hypothetical protein
MSHTGNTALIELTGEVRGTDLDSLRFSLRLADGRTISGNYEPEHERAVLEALGDHSNRRLRIIGVGQFAAGNGNVERILNVRQIELIGSDPQLPDHNPIWERIAQSGAAVPTEAWTGVPLDLSANVDKYLYGAKDPL